MNLDSCPPRPRDSQTLYSGHTIRHSDFQEPCGNSMELCMSLSAHGKSLALSATFPTARPNSLKATSKTTHVSSSLFRRPKRALIRHRKPNSLGGESLRRFSRICLGDVVVDQRLKGRGQLIIVAFQGYIFLAVDVDGAARGFPSAREADANVSGLRFARAVDDTTHDREGHRFHAFILRLPYGHHVADIALNALRQFLKS